MTRERKTGTKLPGATVPELTKEPTVNSNSNGMQRLSRQARAEAAKQGLLPHEWLLKVMRGEAIEQRIWVDVLDKKQMVVGRELKTIQYYPPFAERLDAAKSAAPFYAPKLSVRQIDLRGVLGLTQMSDEELDKALVEMAKQLVTEDNS